MDLPALKLAEIVIVVAGLVAFYVWQMRSLKRDRAELAQRLAQERSQAESLATTAPTTAPTTEATTAPTEAGNGSAPPSGLPGEKAVQASHETAAAPRHS
jgi:hypothetical protein